VNTIVLIVSFCHTRNSLSNCDVY